MPGTGRRSLVAMPLALALGLGVLPLAKGSVDGSLEGQARAALDQAGVIGVDVASEWAGLRLSGPPESRVAALAAVQTMPDRDAVAGVDYVLPPAAPTPDPAVTPTPSTSTPAAIDITAELLIGGAGAARVLTISGTVAGESQRAALRAAVRSWAPKLKIDDRLVVVPDAQPSPELARAYPAFLRLAGQAAAGLTDRGRLRFGPDGLVLSGLASSEASATTMQRLAAEAGARGIAVRSTVIGPLTQARARLRAVKGLRGVSFTRGSERLTPASKQGLTAAAKVIRALPPGVVVEIQGFTDTKGDDALNQRLSQRRANEVLKFLVSAGVPARRLSAKGLGERRPKASNTSATGRAANRRIEFVVKEG